MERSEIEEQLKSTSQELNKFSHVNKKAMDQYINFSERKEELLKKKNEVDAGAESIQSLIKKLDMRKDEAIMRTFGGVQKHFSEVFSELVPSGKGSLILEKSDDAEDENTNSNSYASGESGDEESRVENSMGSPSQDIATTISPNTPRVKSFIGISVKVTFAGELSQRKQARCLVAKKRLLPWH